MGSGLPDLWDAKLNSWILNWDYHQTFHDPLHLFDANIFYPATYALAFSENLYGASLFGFPFYAAGASALLVYNVLFVLGMWLSAMAAWALAREITGDPAASLVAGVVYAFVPWRLAQLPHIQFQWGAFLALALLFLLRYLASGRRRDAVLFSLFFAWNALCNVHYALFSGLLVAGVLGHETLALGWKAVQKKVIGAGIAVAAAGVAVLPFYVPYQRASELYGMRRFMSEIEFFSGRPIDFLTAGPQNKLYAPLTQQLAHPEGDFFPGISVVALAVMAVVLLRVAKPPRAPRPAAEEGRWLRRILDGLVGALLLLWLVATLQSGLKLGPLSIGDPGRVLVFATVPLLIRLWLAFPRWSRFLNLPDYLRRRYADRNTSILVLVVILGVVIALGMHTPYWRFLAGSFGAIFRSIRVPSRGIVLFDLALGVLAAWGLSLATRRISRAGRAAAVAGALAVIGFEYRAFPIDIGDVDPEPLPVYRWLGAAKFSGGVVHWPFAFDPDVEYTFRSTVHWKPIVNGYSGFGPPMYHELSDLLQERPIPDTAWDRMAEMGASVVVFHPEMLRQPSEGLPWLAALREGVKGGQVVPLAAFPTGGSFDIAFRLARTAPFPIGIPEPSPGAAEREAQRRLRALDSVLRVPIGWLDLPREGEAVAVGSQGVGWAMDDSGILEVRVSADGMPAGLAHYGFPHASATAAHPDYPDSARPGFIFAVPRLAPGKHTLVFTFVARDGGRTELPRGIVVR
jgi:hypothetical protein